MHAAEVSLTEVLYVSFPGSGNLQPRTTGVSLNRSSTSDEATPQNGRLV